MPASNRPEPDHGTTPAPASPEHVSDAREEVLSRARAALADAPAPPPVPRHYRRDLAGPDGSGRRGGHATLTDLLNRFVERVIDYRATVARVSPAGLAPTVADLLTDARTLVVPADLPTDWHSDWSGPVRREPVPVADLDKPGVAVLTGCAVAVAETGTLILDGGPAQGRRALSLVPDHHICVVRADQIVAGVPAALARLRDPRRPMTFISGPSATSDIELNRVEGVHGPRRLDVIVID